MATKKNELTPMMKQFFDLKAKNPDAILLFRCGDFYETYCDDAVTASNILGITLTRRNNGGNSGQTEMAGFPYHALDTYLPKLIRAGHRVAICDQLEDPKLTKKLVKRGITELVTPGVAMSDNVLNHKENNFLAAIDFGKGMLGIAFLDISTGEFMSGEGTNDDIEKLISNIQPKEVLYSRDHKADIERMLGNKYYTFPLDEWVFNEQTSRSLLLKHFGVKSLKGFGIDHFRSGITACGAVLQYLGMTQHNAISHITTVSRIDEDKHVRLDKFTARSLELLSTMQEDGKSLLQTIDRTVTPMGSRLLHRWIVFPLKVVKAINYRLDIVEMLFREPGLREIIDNNLQRIGDIERILSRVATLKASPREVMQLKIALDSIAVIKLACMNSDSETIRNIGDRLEVCEELRQRIERELEADAPPMVNKGNVIRRGVNSQLDELRDIAYSSKDYLLKMQERESAQTGISSLKIGYNNVFGYYLEVRNTYKDKVPQEWMRKQTLASAERYITPELKEYEEKILGAEDKIAQLESQLFMDIINGIRAYIPHLQNDARLIAQIDCLQSFASISEENKYVRPDVNDSMVIDIRQGRHPVIETQLPVGERYVPNDVMLDSDGQQIMIITGPNMAGKSALLRQTALIVLMAQIGCFVPAEAAHIGIVDKFFTRVGASDNISSGESTFMVEMTEASSILNNATKRSLVLFDELGRGTSTYDGISIAWAIVEYLHEHKGTQARTLFATHYHELNEMEHHFSRIKNYNVSVQESDGKVVFLRKLQKGGSEHSFGIHVAEISGMPKSIIKRANVILKQLESDNSGVGTAAKPTADIAASREGMQLSFFQLDDPVLSQIRDELLGLDINNLTPVEALNKLNTLKKILKG